MARYFKFHSVAELAAECAQLGLDLRFSDDFTPLFRPVALGPLRAGNALCIQPMEGCDGTLAGEPDELTFRRYQRFGAGGAKLLWGEAAAVLFAERTAGRQAPAGKIRRQPPEPDAFGPDHHRAHPQRGPRTDGRDPPERLRWHPLPHEGGQRRGRAVSLAGAGPEQLGHERGRPLY